MDGFMNVAVTSAGTKPLASTCTSPRALIRAVRRKSTFTGCEALHTPLKVRRSFQSRPPRTWSPSTSIYSRDRGGGAHRRVLPRDRKRDRTCDLKSAWHDVHFWPSLIVLDDWHHTLCSTSTVQSITRTNIPRTTASCRNSRRTALESSASSHTPNTIWTTGHCPVLGRSLKHQ